MVTEISDLAAVPLPPGSTLRLPQRSHWPALRQGAVVLDLMGLDEGWKPTLLSRDDLDVDDLVLVRAAGEKRSRARYAAAPFRDPLLGPSNLRPSATLYAS